uniref:Uncharacterized protein n=1 Tax=Sipha flava TaxID=143950 RepID=A0A2S2PYN2_9HEMI
MDIERLRADEVIWAMYKQGWRDTYATVIAALATVPPSPPVNLRPVTDGSDRGQVSTDSAATGPVRSQARAAQERFRLSAEVARTIDCLYHSNHTRNSGLCDSRTPGTRPVRSECR